MESRSATYTRLDEDTKLSLMTAIIYSLTEQTPEQCVEAAVSLCDLVRQRRQQRRGRGRQGGESYPNRPPRADAAGEGA